MSEFFSSPAPTVKCFPKSDRTIRVCITKPGKAPVEMIADVYSDDDFDAPKDEDLKAFGISRDRDSEYEDEYC